MSRSLVAVVIPVYKQQLEDFECASLKNCIGTLVNYPVIFIGPEGLDTTIYAAACRGLTSFTYYPFDKTFFSGIQGYNQLMLSAPFYETFASFKYILIHQLDAYVFKDELSYWCRQGYDFIGAPSLPHQNEAGEMQFLKGYGKFLGVINRLFRTKLQISNVGNGGFSLRNTRKCYWLLKLLKSKIAVWGDLNEDGFFKYWGNLLSPFFRLPADDVALRFSIEQFPEASLKKMDGRLPFGCHAFEKYDPEIWRRYIKY